MRVFYFIITVDLILSSIGYFYLRQNFSWARTWTFIIFYLLLAINTSASRFWPLETPLFFVKLSAWLSGLWIALMYYLIILGVAHLFLYLIGKAGHFTFPHAKIASCALAFIIAFIGWGTYRAFHPTIRTEKIVTAKLPAGAHYKIVFLTDLHMGQILGRSYAEELVAKVNAQQPDLVLIAGDILDERIMYVDREHTLDALANIKSKQGVYMAFGNHDYLDRPLYWQQRLEAVHIQVLRNQDKILNGKVKITGVNDWSRNKTTNEILELSKNNAQYYSILMDHQPRRMEAASRANYDLYLAGHTHTGQLFPNRQVTKRMYLLDYGRADFGQMTAITNNGYGFWGPPVRTEIAPEMVIIEIIGK